MMRIPLSGKAVSLVDAEDFERVNAFKWSLSRNGSRLYAMRQASGRHVKLHRFILGAQPGQVVDHINGDGLDNRKKNLRLCTQAENSRGSVKHTRGTSSLKGVSFCSDRKRKKPWRVQIVCAGVKEHIGYFASEIEAAKAYDEAARRLFGEFAQPNFPKEAP